MTMFLLTKCIMFDVYLTLASWSGQPLKNICLSQQNYMEIGTLILNGIENINNTSKGMLPPPTGSRFKNMHNSQWHVAGRRRTWIYRKRQIVSSSNDSVVLTRYQIIFTQWTEGTILMVIFPSVQVILVLVVYVANSFADNS